MTKETFSQHWALAYPKTVQISHLFKHQYATRWFRIHSLPNSKRYPENDGEWDILLKRQNEIITDMLGSDTTVSLVTGDFYWNEENDVHITQEAEIFKVYLFTRLDDIYLHKIDAENYDETDVYRSAFAQTIWNYGTHDELLRACALDNVTAFFVSFEKNIIVAPHDGGIDFILKDAVKKDFYKERYKTWLSEREDGL